MSGVLLLVTGSREVACCPVNIALVRRAVRKALGLDHFQAPAAYLHGAGRGVDQVVDQLAAADGLPCFRIPARWSDGKGAGPARNARLVELALALQAAGWGEARCLAIPGAKSRGTYDCARQAEAAGIPTVLWRGLLEQPRIPVLEVAP